MGGLEVRGRGLLREPIRVPWSRGTDKPGLCGEQAYRVQRGGRLAMLETHAGIRSASRCCQATWAGE